VRTLSQCLLGVVVISCVAGQEPAQAPRPEAAINRPAGAAEQTPPTPAPEQAKAIEDENAVSLAELPLQARQTITLIDQGGPYPYTRDGITFQNRERRLPSGSRYKEYTVPTPGERTRGQRRLVQADDGTLYYSDDHYRTFRRVVR
jgi:ribonuclease T1